MGIAHRRMLLFVLYRCLNVKTVSISDLGNLAEKNTKIARIGEY